MPSVIERWRFALECIEISSAPIPTYTHCPADHNPATGLGCGGTCETYNQNEQIANECLLSIPSARHAQAEPTLLEPEHPADQRNP
jgi:hypothetical protein